MSDCDYDNVVKLSREYSCGRGEVVGVLLNVATLHRPHRTKREAIQNGWVGPVDVANPEARELLQTLMNADRVDCQLTALGGLSRLGPTVGSTGVHLICHFVDRICHLVDREGSGGGADPATAVRALEVLPQLVTAGCIDSGSCEVVLEAARNALSRGNCESLRAAATAAIQKISDSVHDISASGTDALQAIQKVSTWDRSNCFRCNKPGHWSAACTEDI
jgi:hypothetical protein